MQPWGFLAVCPILPTVCGCSGGDTGLLELWENILSVLGQHPLLLRVLGEHPLLLNVLGEYPLLLSVLGQHSMLLRALGQPPLLLSVLGMMTGRRCLEQGPDRIRK